MSVSLLETISSYITPDIINKASAFLGETPGSTSKAMTGIVPTLLNNVASLASAPGGLSQLGSLEAAWALVAFSITWGPCSQAETQRPTPWDWEGLCWAQFLAGIQDR